MSERRAERGHAHWGSIRKSAQEILNVRHEIRARETPAAAFVERVGRGLARPGFFLSLLAAHLIWLLLNLPIYPWQPWDPYPFGFLSMIASVEAPFLALLVIMHQQREQRINELREETHLQVALHVEREATMIVRMLRELHEHAGVRTAQEPELVARMEEFMDPRILMGTLREDLKRDEGEDAAIAP